MYRTLTSLVLLALSTPAVAQDGPYLYVTYFECDPAEVAALDAVRTSTVNPALDAHVATGSIMAWGWISHHTGGLWSRANYYVAPTLERLMTFHDSWQVQIAGLSDARAVNQRACPRHVDYIWRQIASSTGREAGNRPATGASTYFQCGPARLGRADEIVRDAFAPILDELIEEGALSAWRWHGHVMGGAFNRLLVLDGDTHMANLRAIERFNDRIAERQERAGTEFSEICAMHQDYMWNLQGSR